jgi:3-oxoacyl-[acyl-carrier protein] reductase
MTLHGKVAIVTGGNSGIGKAVVEALAQQGATIVIDYIADEQAESQLEAELRGLGDNVIGVKADVSKVDDLRRLVTTAVTTFGRLDIMVNNAGISHRNMPMLDVPEAMVDKILAVNVKSIYLAALHVVPVFRRQGKGGSIINTASTAGLRPRPGLTVYNASKGAAVIMTKSMAVEFAPDNIRVNALCPVAGETPLLGTFMGADTPENRAKFKASIPLGRLSTPRDIANAALYLASDDAEFITGIALEVDGGRCV